jgi:hypothetical protein
MKNSLMPIALAALVLTGVQALADDSGAAAKTSANKAQMMKDCMARQKATNSSMTPAAMKTVCKNEVKGNGTKDGNDLATGPKSSTPDDTQPDK